MSNARTTQTGVQSLVDAMPASGATPSALRATMWQSAWARGYDDVVTPLTRPDTIVAGSVIFAQACGPHSCAAIVDDGEHAWGIVAGGYAPALGARVRAVPNYGSGAPWNLSVLDSPALGLEPCFTPQQFATDTRWINDIRAALERIREREVARRTVVDARRRSLPFLARVQPLRDELRYRHDELKARIEAETTPTREELAVFNAANEKARQKIVAERSARRLTRFREELERFRLALPAFLAEREARVAATVDLRVMAQQLEDTKAQSRAVTDRTFVIADQLDAIEHAGLVVVGDPGDALQRTDPALLDEIGRTVELFYALLPRESKPALLAKSRGGSLG